MEFKSVDDLKKLKIHWGLNKEYLKDINSLK